MSNPTATPVALAYRHEVALSAATGAAISPAAFMAFGSSDKPYSPDEDTALAARLRIKLDKCKRFQPAARRTLDGCWKLDGGEVPLLLDGSWTLDGRPLDGRTLTGVPLDNGHIDSRQKITMRLSMTMAGPRCDPPKALGDVWRPLDGSWTLGEMTLQGWPMDEGLSLASAQLDHLALPRLDGTWLLGGELGGPGLWFSGVIRTKQNGLTTQEPL